MPGPTVRAARSNGAMRRRGIVSGDGRRAPSDRRRRASPPSTRRAAAGRRGVRRRTLPAIACRTRKARRRHVTAPVGPVDSRVMSVTSPRARLVDSRTVREVPVLLSCSDSFSEVVLRHRRPRPTAHRPLPSGLPTRRAGGINGRS